MTAALLGETVPVETVAAKVAAAAVLADTDFFAPLFGADLRIPGFFAFGIFRFSFRHRRVTPDLRDYSAVNFAPAAFLLNLRSQGQYIFKNTFRN